MLAIYTPLLMSEILFGRHLAHRKGLSSISRYILLQVFSKYGKVSKLDFLFHKAGPLKGKPRGYAFVEFADPDVSKTSTVLVSVLLIRVSFHPLHGLLDNLMNTRLWFIR